MANFDRSIYDESFSVFLLYLYLLFQVVFAASYAIAVIYCHFNVVNLYTFHCILVFPHSTFNLKQPFLSLLIFQRVEMIALTLLKAILKFISVPFLTL